MVLFLLLCYLLKKNLEKKLAENLLPFFYLSTLFTGGKCPHFEMYGTGKRCLIMCQTITSKKLQGPDSSNTHHGDLHVHLEYTKNWTKSQKGDRKNS